MCDNTRYQMDTNPGLIPQNVKVGLRPTMPTSYAAAISLPPGAEFPQAGLAPYTFSSGGCQRERMSHARLSIMVQ